MTNKADYVGSGGKGKGELSVPVAYYVGNSLCAKKTTRSRTLHEDEDLKVYQNILLCVIKIVKISCIEHTTTNITIITSFPTSY